MRRARHELQYRKCGNGWLAGGGGLKEELEQSTGNECAIIGPKKKSERKLASEHERRRDRDPSGRTQRIVRSNKKSE